MAETTTPFEKVTVHLDRPREIKFTLWSLKKLETKMRETRGDTTDIFDLLSEANKTRLSMDEIIAFFHAGLEHEDPELTEEQVGKMIDVRQLKGVTELLVKALGETVKPAGGGNGAQRRPLAPSPGPTSGRSGGSS